MSTALIPRSPHIPVGIRGLGYYLPARRVTNGDLVDLGSPFSADRIVEKTGVQTRYVAADHEAMSDLAATAARAALANAGLSPAHVDTIAVSGDCHDSGGVQLTSALVARALGIAEVSCLDWRAGCPSSVLALHQGTALLASGLAQRPLVIAAEITTRPLDYTDPNAGFFGDGAGAVVLERCVPGTGILVSAVAGTGEGSEMLLIPAGGSREPLTHEGLDAGRHLLHMDGRAVFRFAVHRMVESLEIVTAFLGMTPHDLDHIIPHQANLRIIEAVMKQLKLPVERAVINIDRVGNTAGASVLLALAEAVYTGAVRPGDLVATVGFGGGLAWGAQVLRMNCPGDFLPISHQR